MENENFSERAVVARSVARLGGLWKRSESQDPILESRRYACETNESPKRPALSTGAKAANSSLVPTF